MPRPDDEVPAGPAENDDLPPDASDTDSDPSGVDSQTPVATDDESTRTLRDIQTTHGRQLADERRAREAAQSQVVALSQQVEQLRTYVERVGSQFSQQEQARRAAYLQSLAPEARTRAELEMLKQEVAAQRRGQQAPQTQEQYSDAEIRAYMAQRSQEIVDAANDDFGLDGDELLSNITAETPGVDWTDEDTFKRSVRKLARQRALGRENPVADPKKSNEQRRTPASADSAGRPNSARPAAGGRSTLDVEKETQRVFMGSRNSKSGIQGRKAALKEVQKRARENLDRVAAR